MSSFFFFLKNYLLFYVYDCFSWMYACASLAWYPRNSEEGTASLWNRSYRQLEATTWVLGSRLLSSVRASSVRNLWATSPAIHTPLWNQNQNMNSVDWPHVPLNYLSANPPPSPFGQETLRICQGKDCRNTDTTKPQTEWQGLAVLPGLTGNAVAHEDSIGGWEHEIRKDNRNICFCLHF